VIIIMHVMLFLKTFYQIQFYSLRELRGLRGEIKFFD